MSSKRFPSGRPLCDGYVKYKEANFDRLLAILKKNKLLRRRWRTVWNTAARLAFVAALLLQRSILLY